MELQERDRVLMRLLAVWPTPKMPDPTMAVWVEHISKMRYEQASEAVAKLEKTSKHRPSLADFHEAYDALRTKYGGSNVLAGPTCGTCADGWVVVRCNTETHDCDCGDTFVRDDRCPLGIPTLSRCPNGCKPKTHDEREAERRAENVRARQERRRGQATLAHVAARDYTEPSPKDDDEPF
jgi:hypothetical protein